MFWMMNQADILVTIELGISMLKRVSYFPVVSHVAAQERRSVQEKATKQ